MKSNNYKLLFPFFIIFILTSLSCTKRPINGLLDGRWQIMEIEDKGEVSYVKDNKLYYNFSLHVCSLTGYGYVLTNGNLKYENNTIWLDFPYGHTEEMRLKLQGYGIYKNPVTMEVEYLDRKKLILKEDDVVITLRRF